MKRNELTLGDYEFLKRLEKLNPENILFQINRLLDWEPILQLVSPLDSRVKNLTGRDSYDPLMMFKIQLIQDLKGYSDPQMEERLISDVLYMWFCGISVSAKAPDHSTIARWRDRFNKASVSKQAFEEVNRQLLAQGISYKRGLVTDATLIQAHPRLRYKDEIYEIDAETGETIKSEAHITKGKGDVIISSDDTMQTTVVEKSVIDPDAKVVKIGKSLIYGFKMHTLTNLEGLIFNLLTTSANVPEGKKLPELLSFIPDDEFIKLLADKGYCWQSCIDYLNEHGFIDRIMRKKKRNQVMDETTILFNRSISGARFVIERTFGGLKRWLKMGRATYIGLEKVHNHNLRRAMIYNIVRCGGIV
jgi:IS5 family transposase